MDLILEDDNDNSVVVIRDIEEWQRGRSSNAFAQLILRQLKMSLERMAQLQEEEE
jgi:hypothetical protein